MINPAVRLLVAGSLGLSLFACGDGQQSNASKAAKVQPPHSLAPGSAAAAGDSGGAKSGEPYTGKWTMGLLVRRLEDAGMRVNASDSVFKYEHLSVDGHYIKMGRGDVLAFIYPDTIQSKLEVARLDSTTAAPPGKVMKWPTVITLVRSLNLIAILVIDSPGHSERVALAIQGGLPPPEP